MSNSASVLTPAQACSHCSPVASEPLPRERAEQVSALLKALADPVRLRLMSLIASDEAGEVCVCDLTAHFEVSQPTISHHLKVLHGAGLIERHKRGTWVYYRPCRDALDSIAALFSRAC